jgi:gamma-glutamyltranspeptidase/glutathione hydrolase
VVWVLTGLCGVLATGRGSAGALNEAPGAVATVHPLASAAGLAALARGGNAVDATIAAALTLGVVDGHNSGIGGGCLLLARLADGSVVAIDGRETAPALATRDMFIRNGKADPALSRTGALAVGVPGALAAYEYAAARYGKLPLADHLRAAADLAERGFALDRHYAARLAETAKDLARFPEARAVFLRPDGRPRRAGELLRQPDLARTYRAIAEHGVGWFYRGPFAEATAGWMRAYGGLLTREDFARYEVKLREPLRSRYRGFEIIGFPPPSSGGVHVAQILNILEHFDLKAMGPNSADFVHVSAEAMKLAFADRAHWLGDSDFTPVPRGLVSREYGADLAARIHLDRATPVPGHGTPPRAGEELFGKHTTHFSAADKDGVWVACTATINTSFGAKVVVPGTGVVLNNQMDDFVAQPGASNYFGLAGAAANAVAPGKRPLSSMSPTLVLEQGRPELSVGAAGGPTIISQAVLAIVRRIDFGMSVQAALKVPRFHHQWRPDELRVERGWSAAVLRELRNRGHKVVRGGSLGATQAVATGPNGRGFVAVRDPRVE